MVLGGLRGRLALALVGLVAVTVLAIGLGTYAFVDARLRDGLLADASRQAQFDLSVLVPDRLGPGATSADFRASGLPEAFRLRADGETIVDFGAGDVYVSSDDLSGALASLPEALRSAAEAGRLTYAWTSVAGVPSLIVAGRQGGGPVFYFLSPTGTIDAALDQLRLGLVAGGLIAVAVALLAAGWIARRILVPVRSASMAAARIAGGDLTARVPEVGADELAAWAAEFNRMAAALQQTIGRLEAAQLQNRRFVADVSHELRTPLAALVAEASLIEVDLGGLSPDARRAGELLVADVRRLRVLVEDLMELSRFDADAEEPTLVPIDLGRAASAIVRARLPEAAVDVEAEPLMVPAELRRLDRIIGNLPRQCPDPRAGTGRGDGAPRATRVRRDGRRARRGHRRRPRSGGRGRRAVAPLRPVLQGRRLTSGPAAPALAWRSPPSTLAPGRIAAGREPSRRRVGGHAPAACDRFVTAGR